MKRYLLLSLVILVVIGALFVGVYAIQQNESNPTNNNDSEGFEMSKGLEMIFDITKGNYGTVNYVGPTTDGNTPKYDDDTIEFEDLDFRYYIIEDGSYIKSILRKAESKKPLFSRISSIDEAEDHALLIASAAFPELCTIDYDIFAKVFGEGDSSFYSVEIWQKDDNKVYTGRKASVQLTVDGRLELFVAIDSDYSENPQEPKIDEETAISLAYEACKEKILEDGASVEPDSSSDNEPYIIFIGNKSDHQINSYLTYFNNQRVWVIKISGVKTNRFWGDQEFEIRLNSDTGEIIFYGHTR